VTPPDGPTAVSPAKGGGGAVGRADETVGRQRHRLAQVLLVVTMVGVTAGVLAIVVQNSVWLGRMTTDISVAQQRTTNLHNLQQQTSRLLQQLTELQDGGNTETVTVRRGLVGRMLDVVMALFPADSAEWRELRVIQAEMQRFPWSRLADRDDALARGAAKTTVSQAETRLKRMYDAQEKFFYAATLESLQAKRASQNALALLVSLVVVLAVCSLLLLRRRNPNRLDRAYAALLAEVSERRTLQEQLTHQAFHDALTGLPNRALFVRRLADLVETGDRGGRRGVGHSDRSRRFQERQRHARPRRRRRAPAADRRPAAHLHAGRGHRRPARR
jgi:hypothetical protein